ncbi:ABC transporter substrate-binding protein [Archangium lansingense]|uniref:ABC transporter substrate-binding protein n=1 Tax=Archangium lansingense TaxID=2995310 RepID=A0ABT4A015_9BACT|nr:ABC transporter substrate-binding protein [Archangium lansinium]MCY1074921.1 ABC transporter substrate-binding protein [Archangium lansinium]
MRSLVRVAGLFLFLVVSACTREDELPLRVGTFLWSGSEPLFLARDLGYLDDGSSRLIEYSSLGEVNRDFRNGRIDAVAISLDMALEFQQQGFEPRVVLVLDYSNGADALLARPEVRRLEDLRGKRVAVEAMSTSNYMLSRALAKAGLQPSDIEILRIPMDQHERAYALGQVDAVVTFEPFVSKLLAEGAHRLFDSSHLPGELVDVLVVREDMLEQRPEQVRHLLQGWFRALRYLEEHPEDALSRMSPRLGTSPAGLASQLEDLRHPSLRENRSLLGEPASPLLDSAYSQQRFMLEAGLLHAPVRPEQMLDARPLEALEEER